ncbi:MAG: O-antigen ligase family protein, partial [Anaerolineae bacterium]|nr:O-antigen ligase family protein [Anaerolineae bacterium]
TILAYLYERRRLDRSIFPDIWHATYLFGLGFVIWVFISNPDASLRQGRGVALLTFFQLAALVLLASELMSDDPGKHRVLMWVYVIACLISANDAIQQSALTETFDTSGGSGGLSGISTNARQFTIAFMFLFYLRGQLKGRRRILGLLMWVAQIYLLQGVAVTGSRTGIVIVVIGIILMLLSPTSRIKPQRVILPAIVAATIYVAVPDTFWDSMWNSIFPTIEEGGDTLATRYELWDTAIRMVQDKPFTGVGINQFQRNVLAYSDPLSSTVVVTGAHSIYFSVLAETGVVGFVLYMGMVGSSLIYAVRAAFRMQNEDLKNLAYLWFVALVLLLIGGITKQDQHDKLLWLVFGMCTGMNYFLQRERRALQAEEKPAYVTSVAAYNGNGAH